MGNHYLRNHHSSTLFFNQEKAYVTTLITLYEWLANSVVEGTTFLSPLLTHLCEIPGTLIELS